MPSNLEIKDTFLGFDLPRLRGETGYVRGRRNIYVVDRGSRKVLEIIPIASVILW